MSDNQKILDRLKKLLALAKSTNPNEAATALRQAQKLMAEHALTATDIEMLDIDRQESTFTASSMPATHMMNLAGVIEDTFGVRALLTGHTGAVHFSFVGLAQRVEVAVYVFDVVIRQLIRYRKEYIASLSKRMKRATKTRRADLYCRAWVIRVSETVQRFEIPEKELQLLESYLGRHFNTTSTYKATTRKASRRDASAALAGYRDGSKVSINRAMSGTKPADRLGGPV